MHAYWAAQQPCEASMTFRFGLIGLNRMDRQTNRRQTLRVLFYFFLFFSFLFVYLVYDFHNNNNNNNNSNTRSPLEGGSTETMMRRLRSS